MSNQIPEEWCISSLESNASLITDGSHFSPQTCEMGKPIATVQNMRPRHIDVASCRLISPENFDELVKGNCLPEYDDVLFSKDGTIGKTFVYKQQQPIVLLSSIAIIRLKKSQLNPDYCTQYLQSSLFYKQLENATSGSAIRRVVLKDIKQLKLPIPPLPEQQKIAAILTSVDEVIEKTQAQIDKLKDLKSGMMQELLTKGVGIKQGDKYEPHTEFKDSPVGKIPKSWEVVTIDQLLSKKIISSIQDGNHGEKHPKSADFVAQGIPFIMASDIHNQVIDFEGTNKIPEHIYNNLRIGFSKAGDVLLSHKATVGLTAVVPKNIEKLMLTPQVTYYRIGDTAKLLNWFLHYSFQSGYFQKNIAVLSAQSTRSYIGIKAQRELEIVLPNTIEEQQEIVHILQSLDKKNTLINAKLKALKNTKKALMQDLLTGKVRVKLDNDSVS